VAVSYATLRRFLETHHHVAIAGSGGVGKTFLAHALGHVTCRRGYSVLAVRADGMLKTLNQARLTQRHETELVEPEGRRGARVAHLLRHVQ
jgi:DNA replication protein DnaC